MTTGTTQAVQNCVYLSGRASFPNLVDPQVKTNEKGETQISYNCDIIFPPNDPGFTKFMQTYAAMAQDQWKENAQAAMQMIQSNRKLRCYGDGSEKVSAKTFQVHPGYAGNVFISARSLRQPQIIGPDGKPIDPSNTMQLRAEASRIEGGVLINAAVKIWLQKNAHGVGVRCDLLAVQFAKDDGTRFGAGTTDVTPFFGAVQGAAPAAPAFGAVAAPQMPAAPFGATQPAAPSFGAPGMPSFM